MYNLPYFKDRDDEAVVDFMQRHPFAALIGATEARAVATQVPLLPEKRNGILILRGHLMRGTDHQRAFEENTEALCVFSGAHTYVSARWYSNPQTGSTWNYMSVHARGAIRFLPENDLRKILAETTARFENDADSPAAFERLPNEYVASLLKMIIGFEIEVQTLEHVFKLSQNRDEPSYENIITRLEAQNRDDARTIAAEMRNEKRSSFRAEARKASSFTSSSPRHLRQNFRRRR